MILGDNLTICYTNTRDLVNIEKIHDKKEKCFFYP